MTKLGRKTRSGSLVSPQGRGADGADGADGAEEDDSVEGAF